MFGSEARYRVSGLNDGQESALFRICMVFDDRFLEDQSPFILDFGRDRDLVFLVDRLAYSKYGKSHYFSVSFSYLVVTVVLAIHLTCNGNRFSGEILKSEQRSGSVGKECISVVFITACTHVRKNGYALKSIVRSVVSETFCRKSYLDSVLIKSILKSHPEKCRRLVISYVVGYRVVRIKVFVRICRDILFNA